MNTKSRRKHTSTILLSSVIIFFTLFFVWVQRTQAAEVYPSKPIKFIIGGKSGDMFDAIGRKASPTLAKKLGVNVMPIDHLGPMSVNFFDAVHDARPDGYTLGFGASTHRLYHVIKPGRLKYDIETLPVVAGMRTFPDLVWASVKSKTGIKTAKDLLNYKGPIRLNLYSPILAGVCSLAIVAKERNLDLRPVMFDSFPDGHVAMLRGDVDIGTTAPSGGPLKNIQAGDYIPLFVWGKERFEKLPDTPCSRELGLNPELEDTELHRVFLVPKGTPTDRMAKLLQGIEATLSDPEVLQWGKEANQPLGFMTSDEFDKREGKLLKFYMKHIETLKPFLK